MVRRRLSTLVLMLALILPILAACGGDTAGETAGTAVTGAGEVAATAASNVAEGAATAETAGEGAAATAAPAEGEGGVAPAGEGATAGASGDVTQIPVEEGASLTIIVNGNATEQQLYQEGVARFNEIFPNVNVQVQVNNDNYETNMKAQFAAGTAPDVFLLPPQLLGAFGPEGLLLPLNDYMQQAGVEPSDYVEPLINLFTIDGQIYGLPKDFNPLVVFINEEMAQEAGVDPASIQTWDDLKAAAQQMTKGEGAGTQYGMCLNPDIQRYGASILQNGNPVVENNQAVFNQESGVEAINFWYSFKEEGSGELFKQLGKNWCGEAFAGRNTAMAVEGGWIVPFLADPSNNATDLQYTAIPLPIPEGGQQATWLFTNGFGVNANTQYPAAAAALAIYLTSAQNQSALIPSGLAQPSLVALVEDPYYQDNPVAKVLVEQGQSGRLVDTTLGGPERVGDVVSAMNQAMEAIFLGQATTQDALDQAAQEVDSILSQ